MMQRQTAVNLNSKSILCVLTSDFLLCFHWESPESLLTGHMDGSLFRHVMSSEGQILSSSLVFKSRLLTNPDAFAVIDIKTDYMNRVLFADQNQNVRIAEGRFVEIIVNKITGAFGKCIKINANRDTMYTIREDFVLIVTDLTKEKFPPKEAIEFKEKIDLLSDWCIDYKSKMYFFLFSTGAIVVYISKSKQQLNFRVEEKWFLLLAKEDRNFTAMTLSFNMKLLAISGVVAYKGKKTNNLFLYSIDPDKKTEIRLTLLSQIATENTWDGTKDYVNFIDMSTTINKQQVIVCSTQCSSTVSVFIVCKDKLVALSPPKKVHSSKLRFDRRFIERVGLRREVPGDVLDVCL